MVHLILSALFVLLTAPGLEPGSAPLEFVAEMRGEHVAPEAVQTGASGRAIGVLVGNRFTVQGSFAGLSSALRDIEKTPDDPGVHLHRGAPGETTTYFFGLRVRLNADERSGIFWGTVELDDEQRALLLSNRMYVDIHTVRHYPGEVRDQWRPLDPAAAARLRAALRHPDPEVASEACHAPPAEPAS
jgi:hypothetical protein